MMHQLRMAACAIAALMAGTGTAAAQSWYYGAHGGLNLALEADYEQGGRFDVEFDTGPAIGAFVGYDSGAGWRLEGEITRRSNDFDTFVGAAAGGDIGSFAVMVSGFRDFGAGKQFMPYIGAGVGMAKISINDFDVLGSPVADDDDTVLAYQIGAGVGYMLSPTTTITTGYRFFATDDFEMVDLSGVPFTGEYTNSTFLVGLRFAY